MKKMMKPWSGPNYHENKNRAGQYEPCAYCGKAIKNKKAAFYVEVLCSGEFADDAPGSAPSQGGFPLGPDCARRYKTERSQKNC